MRVSYWILCNAGSLADWTRLWTESNKHNASAALFPVSFVARCVAHVCETLHVMYQTGPEAVYHCDLHMANVFVHFGSNRSGGSSGGLPDFYIGDFGWARTASEARVDGVALYGGGGEEEVRAGMLSAWREAHPGFEFPSPPPGVVPPGQRRRWDVARILEGLNMLVKFAVPTVTAPVTGGFMAPAADQPGLSEQAVGLRRLVMMMKFLDEQDQVLAVRNEWSRPPYLLEVVREARKLEAVALAAEQGTEIFNAFLAMGRSQAEQISKDGRPFVYSSAESLTPELTKLHAVNYGEANIDGPWSLVESV